MAFLLDVECCHHEDVEDLVKASVERGRESIIWEPLQNPWGRKLVADVTVRFQAAVGQMERALASFLRGRTATLGKADAPWVRIDEARLEQVRARLASLDPALMTFEDYQLLVEYLIQRYLPDDFAMTEGEFLAVRAVLLGKIQANLEHDRRMTDPMIATLSALLPTDFAQVPIHVLSPIELSVLAYGRAHAAENIRHVSETARHRMQTIVLEHMQAQHLGQKEGTWAYAQRRLFDEFADLNRDFRRIAVTESGEMVNQGYVAAVESGRRVKRIEAYRGACDFCKSINGKVFEVVAPDAPNKDGQTQVWPGKTNIGRSASPMKRVGTALVPREPDEMWWPAAGVQHPHCRGAWVSVANRPAHVSVEFHDWLQSKLDEAMRHGAA